MSYESKSKDIEKKPIYLDAAATTRPVEIQMSDSEKKEIEDIIWANPSSSHTLGRKAFALLEEARKNVADFINADPDEIYFCNSGTMANNLALKGVAEALYYVNDFVSTYHYVNLVSGKTEHPSVHNISKKWCYGIPYLIKEGSLDEIKEYKDLLKNEHNKDRLNNKNMEGDYENRIISSFMMANNETGHIYNTKVFCDIAHEYENSYFHTDATAYIGHYDVDVKKLGVDLLTFSGHKINVPRGVAVLYKKKDVPFTSFVHGGKQEDGVFPGTENLSLIYALGKRVKQIKEQRRERQKKELDLFNGFGASIAYACHDLCSYSYNDPGCTLAAINNVQFVGIDALKLMTLLDMEGVYCSRGSACSSGNNEPSHVLKAIGLSDEEANNSLRFSFDSEWNTVEEMEEFGKRLRECLQKVIYIRK